MSLYDIQLEVVSGQVTLSGVVDAEYKRDAVLEIVRTTEGVWNVENKIEVDPFYSRSDEEILKILESVMSRLWLKPGETIVVKVREGTVSLEGVVSRRHIKSLAGSLAWELSCVRDVTNMIVLKESPSVHVRITPGELMQFV